MDFQKIGDEKTNSLETEEVWVALIFSPTSSKLGPCGNYIEGRYTFKLSKTRCVWNGQNYDFLKGSFDVALFDVHLTSDTLRNEKHKHAK